MKTNGNGNSNQEQGWLSKALKLAAYPVAGFIGFWVARDHIRHSTFTKLEEEGALKDIYTPYIGKKEKIYDAMGREGITRKEWKALKKESRALSKKYTGDLRDRFEKLGLNDLRSQTREIYKQQTQKALIEGFTAATIVMGGLLILANSKTLSHAFAHREEEDKARDGAGGHTVG